MKIFVPPDFAKRAAKESVSDNDLRKVIVRAEGYQIDAQLGLALIKQRIPRQGQGRSRGFRSIIAYKRGEIAIFLYLFPKSAKANLSRTETEEYRTLAGYLMSLSDEALTRLASERGWRLIEDEQPEEDVPK